MDKLKLLILSHARTFLKPTSIKILNSMSFADLCIYYAVVLKQRLLTAGSASAHDGVPDSLELAETKAVRDNPEHRRTAHWMCGIFNRIRRENLACYCYLYPNTSPQEFEAENLQILINADFPATLDRRDTQRRFR